MIALSTLPLPFVRANAAPPAADLSQRRPAFTLKFSHEKPRALDLSWSFLDFHRMPTQARSSTITGSIVLHAILVAAAILVPMWFADTLDFRTYTKTFLVGPPPPPPAPSAPTPVAARAVTRSASERLTNAKGQLFLPPTIPKKVAMLNEEPLPEEGILGVPGGVVGGVPGGVLGGILASGMFEPKTPVAPIAPEKPRGPVQVGGSVKPPRILSRQAPEYPPLAQQSHVQGDVIISAIIDAQGNIAEMKMVSGHPLLIEAAMKALRSWKFEPTYLNGQPWPVSWDITVKFRLG